MADQEETQDEATAERTDEAPADVAEEVPADAVDDAVSAAVEEAPAEQSEQAPAAPVSHTPEGSPHFIPAPPAGKGQIVFFRSSAMGFAIGCTVNQGTVITSYSIHYTKLYD